MAAFDRDEGRGDGLSSACTVGRRRGGGAPRLTLDARRMPRAIAGSDSGRLQVDAGCRFERAAGSVSRSQNWRAEIVGGLGARGPPIIVEIKVYRRGRPLVAEEIRRADACSSCVAGFGLASARAARRALRRRPAPARRRCAWRYRSWLRYSFAGRHRTIGPVVEHRPSPPSSFVTHRAVQGKSGRGRRDRPAFARVGR